MAGWGLSLLLLGWVALAVEANSRCPWKKPGLLSWHDPSTWESGAVPGEMELAVIPSGKRVMLSASTALLAGLIIEPDAALVWDNEDGITLDTHNILILGELHIGAIGCRFNKKARIRLHGHSTDEFYVDLEGFGRKFIGVAPGGTLELHGSRKTSWTQLAQTAPAGTSLDCALVYDHSDIEKYHVGIERQVGLHTIVWNEDGSLMDFEVFKEDYKEFEPFFQTVPDGKVVGLFAFGAKGLGRKVSRLEAPLKAMGGKINGQVPPGDSYSFIAVKGYPEYTLEFTKPDGQTEAAPLDYLQIHNPDDKVVFEVSTSIDDLATYFRVLREEAVFPILTLKDEPEGWEPYDQVAVMSTDFDWQQSEVRRLLPCPECSPRQIRVDNTFRYTHYGNFTQRVDERAEVALLTRNILIEGVMADECYYNDREEQKLCKKFNRDTFGGHIKIVKGHKSVHIRGVEVTHMGQQKLLGHYPIHFHMCDDAPGRWIVENSIHHTFSRCMTIHGTNMLNVSHNVCFDHYGHGLFLEDGVEQENLIVGNLVANTQHGTLLLSDMNRDWCKVEQKKWLENCGDLSSYWITHPNNVLINNVAAGSQGNGFMYVFSDIPLGPSFERQQQLGRRHHPKDYPLVFSHNVAHSNYKSGVFMDSKLSTGTGMENKGMVPENGILQTENEYDPHVDGKPVWVEMSYGTYYKNVDDNLWIKGGNIRVSYSSIADSPQGFSGGTTLFDSGTEVYKSLFIGETDNKGLGRNRAVPNGTDSTEKIMYYFDRSFAGTPIESLTAVGIYQGPIIIKHCFFDRYVTRTWCVNEKNGKCAAKDTLVRHAGAISFKRSNNYPTMTPTYTQNNTFGFCDGDKLGQRWVFLGDPSMPDWQWKDGNYGLFFEDRDGKLTGTPRAAVVRDIPLYLGDECQMRPDWGPLAVCPYRYIKMEILGTTGNLGGDRQRDYPLIIRRDDEPYDEPFEIQGEIRNEFLLRTHRSYIVDFNFSKDGSAFPSDYKIYGYGVERQDAVRVGICQPEGVTGFDIFMRYPAGIKDNATWVSSLEEVDASTDGTVFFFDNTRGILFFKILSFHDRTNETQMCSDGHCWLLKITLRGGDLKTPRSCRKYSIPPYIGDTGKPPSKPRKPKCPGIGTPEGLGSVDWNDVGFVEHTDYTVPCPDTTKPQNPGRQKPKYKGCFLEKYRKDEYQFDLMELELLELFNSMNVDFCIDRCYQRGYTYAALSRSRRCTCGNLLMDDEKFVGKPGKDCKNRCVGNPDQFCGGKKYLDVWYTGQ